MKKYKNKQFGLELRNHLSKRRDFLYISRWAFNIYIEHGSEFERGLDDFVLKLVAMQEGPEFQLSKEELESMVQLLITKR